MLKVLAAAAVSFVLLWRGYLLAESWLLTRVMVIGSKAFNFGFFNQRWCSERGASDMLEKLLARRRGRLTFNYPARWGGNYIQTRHSADGTGWDVEYHICNPESVLQAYLQDHTPCQHWGLHADNRERPVDEDFVRSMVGHFLAGYEPPSPYFKDIRHVLTPGTDDDDLAPPDAEPQPA